MYSTHALTSSEPVAYLSASLETKWFESRKVQNGNHKKCVNVFKFRNKVQQACHMPRKTIPFDEHVVS